MTYKVLVIDDSKLARMAVVKALKSCYPGGTVVEAGSAEAALSAMRTTRRISPSSTSTCRHATACWSRRTCAK